MLAFGEKSRNISTGQSAAAATTWLRNVTKLDNLQYMLFGAHNLEETKEGVECDKWLPVIGGVQGTLGEVVRLKSNFDACIQRVFEGMYVANLEQRKARVQRRLTVRAERLSARSADAGIDRDAEAAMEGENEAEDENVEDNQKGHSGARHIPTSLTTAELLELKFLTRDVVGVLSHYHEDRRTFRLRSRSDSPTSRSPSLRPSLPSTPPSPGRTSQAVSAVAESAFSRMRISATQKSKRSARS